MIYTESMEVEAKYFGLVIGHHQSGLRYLASMPGITAVEFNPSRRPNVHSRPLSVRGTSQAACRAAMDHVSLRIVVEQSTNARRFPRLSWILLPEGIADGRLSLKSVQHAKKGEIKTRVGADDDATDAFFVSGIHHVTSIKSTAPNNYTRSQNHWTVASGIVDAEYRFSSYNREELGTSLFEIAQSLFAPE